MIAAALGTLATTQNADGGWGAVSGRRSATEPTALTVLALHAVGQRSLASAAARGVAWLRRRQRPDGSWPVIAEVAEGGWATSLAVLALTGLDRDADAPLRGGLWLLDQQAYREGAVASMLRRLGLARSELGALDPRLAGWPWVASTASWVEPTAYALIALKKLRGRLEPSRSESRIRTAEAMMLNRACRGGGWNYGNAEVLGETLQPFPDVTGVALIALRDRIARHDAAQGFTALGAMLADVDSGLSLSWAALACATYGRPVSDYRQRLWRAYARTRFFGETKTIALAVLAHGNGWRLLGV